MERAILGLVLDSSIIIEAERKRQTVEEFLRSIRQALGEIEISISAITVAELAHGLARANTYVIRDRRRAFIDELKRHVPVHPVIDESGEIAGKLSGELAAQGMKISIDDLLIGIAAIEQGYAAATLNLRHFKKIPGLTIVHA